MVSQFFRRILNLYPGEGRMAFLFSLLAFLTAAACSGVVAISDGQFLGHIGSQGLGIVYLITALAMLAFSIVQIIGLGRVSARQSFLLILSAGVALIGIEAAALLHGALPKAAWYGLWIVGDMVYLVTLAGLWNFIDQSYDLQDAKRQYGLLSASMILGFAAGAGLASVLIEMWSAGGVMVVYASLFGLAFALAVYLSKTVQPLAETPHEATATEEHRTLKGIFAQVLTSRFTMLLILFGIAMGLAEFLMEFSYMDALEKVFGANGEASSEELTHFMGATRGWVYLADVVVGSLFYSRIIRRIGVENANLVPAGYFFLIFLSFPLLQGLIFAVLGLIAVEGALVAFYDNNLSILLNGVPARVKAQLRVFVQNFIEPLGMLLVAILLLVFEKQALLIGGATAAIAVGIALLMRKKYRLAILEHLRQNASPDVSLHFECNAEALWDEVAEAKPEWDRSSLDEQLASEKAEEVCLGITLLGLQGSPHIFDQVLPYLSHEAVQVRRTAMHALSHLATPSARRHTRRLLKVLATAEDTAIRHHCLRALESLVEVRDVRDLVIGISRAARNEWAPVEATVSQMGRRTLPVVMGMIRDAHLPSEARLLACRIATRLSASVPKTVIHALVEKEIEQAFADYYQWHQGASSEELFRQRIDLIVHLLGIGGHLEECNVLCTALRSANEKIHSHAVESLEKGCELRLFRRLLPLIDDRPASEKLRVLQNTKLVSSKT
jgi:hypothetical protein